MDHPNENGIFHQHKMGYSSLISPLLTLSADWVALNTHISGIFTLGKVNVNVTNEKYLENN